jgi:hypothetical protein
MGAKMMTATAKNICGASAFIQPLYPATGPAADLGLLSERYDSSGHPWESAIDQLLAMRGWEDDWDGQGATAPIPGAVDTALKIAIYLRSNAVLEPDRVVAGVNGTVFFEWFGKALFNLQSDYTEIEVTAPGQAEGRMVSKDCNLTEEFMLIL